MRIVWLLPSATEVIARLGLADSLDLAGEMPRTLAYLRGHALRVAA